MHDSTSDRGAIRDDETIVRVRPISWYTFAISYTMWRVPTGNPCVIIKELSVVTCRDRPCGAIAACSGTKAAFLEDDFGFLPVIGKNESGDDSSMISERRHISIWWIRCSW